MHAVYLPLVGLSDSKFGTIFPDKHIISEQAQMKLSARIMLRGTVTIIVTGAVTTHVHFDVGDTL